MTVLTLIKTFKATKVPVQEIASYRLPRNCPTLMQELKIMNAKKRVF